jgi:hypothetical protein
LQLLSKQFYYGFSPNLQNFIKLYEVGNVTQAVFVYPGQEKYVNVLDFQRGFKWKKQPIILEGKGFTALPQWPLWPKIIQVTQDSCLIVGGNTGPQNVKSRQVYSINTSRWAVSKRAPMKFGR